jgi:hypothetical protein
VHNLIETEKIRRGMALDKASVERYETAVAKAWSDGLTEGTPAYAEQQENHQLTMDALDRGDPHPHHWWTATASGQRAVIEAFILRRDLEQDGQRRDDASGRRLAGLERAFEELNAEAAAYQPAAPAISRVSTERGSPATPSDPIPVVTAISPSPGDALPAKGAATVERPLVRPERSEPDWGPDEDRTMSRWAGTGSPVSDCLLSNVRHMKAAIERERNGGVRSETSPLSTSMSRRPVGSMPTLRKRRPRSVSTRSSGPARWGSGPFLHQAWNHSVRRSSEGTTSTFIR